MRSKPDWEIICSEIARLLKEERVSKGFSLNALAEKAGLSRQTVTFVEQEERNPTLETLLRITLALEINLDEIIVRARKRLKAVKKTSLTAKGIRPH